MVIVVVACTLLMLMLISEPTAEEMSERHKQFQDLYFRQNEEEFARLAKEGQAPKTLFIGCSDSRVIPELITSSKPGELFVVRTAGNFVPPYTKQEDNTGVIGTIEFGVNVLGVSEIIVCGHSQCGAIAGLYQDLSDKNLAFLTKWLANGEAAKEMCRNVPESQRLEQTEKNSVLYQLKHLLTYPFIKEKVESDALSLHGWYFEIASGSIYYYDLQQYRFVKLG